MRLHEDEDNCSDEKSDTSLTREDSTDKLPVDHRGEMTETRDDNVEETEGDEKKKDSVEIVEDDETEAEAVNPAPDGGYGWLIVFGSLLSHLLIGGMERSAGTLFLKLDERYNKSAALTAWVLSIPAGTRLTLGPVCSALCHRFSIRSVVCTGAVLLFLSIVISAFSPNLEFLFFSFGILGGLGRCLAYAPGVIVVGLYFNKKLGIGVGIATSGVGFGAFLFPTIIEVLFVTYGYTGAFLIMGAILLNLAVCGALFRPLSKHLKILEWEKRQKALTDGEKGGKLLPPPLDLQISSQIQWHSVQSIENGINPSDFAEKPKSAEMKNGRKSFSERKESLSNTIKSAICCSKSNEKSDELKRQLFEISLLKDTRFLCYCIALLMFTIAFQSAFVFIPPYAKSNGMSDLQATYLIAIVGGCDGVGRICSGIILDRENIRKYRFIVYNIDMLLIGCLSFMVPQLTTFNELAILCAFYGLLTGTYFSQKSVIIVDILGASKLISSFGILIFFQGIGMFLGPPIAGAMKDVDGHFDNGFYFGGGSMIFGALILGSAIFHHRLKEKQSKLPTS